MTMRVCFVSGSYPPIRCGIGDFTQRLAAALTQQGVDVVVLTSKDSVMPGRDGAVLRVPIVSNWNLRALPAILTELRALAPDLVNIQYPTPRYGRQPLVNLLPWFIRTRLHIPTVTTVHEFSTFQWLGKWRIGLSVLSSDYIIVPDQVNLEQMRRMFPNVRSRSTRVPIGANIEPQLPNDFDRQRVRAGYRATDTDVVIAYFGFISPSKGIETLLRAFKRASQAQPNLHLLLIASREPADPNYAAYHHQIATLIEESTVNDRIFWTGYASALQISAYLASADFAALPFTDGASLRRTSLLTALAHGLPVISTALPNPIPDSLHDETGLVLTPVQDALALEKAIIDLANDDIRRKTLAAGARQFAGTISWTGISTQTLVVYRHILGV